MAEITIREAAERSGLSYDCILHAVQTGSLPARRLPACWLIRADVLAVALRSGTLPRRRGRPRKEEKKEKKDVG